METVLSVVLLLFVLFAVAGTVVTVRTVRAVRRGVRRTGIQARRMVEDATLRAKSHSQFGPAAELARLRLSLRSSVTGTREVLRARVVGDPSLGEALDLLERLRGHAHALDDELRMLEREPDRGRVTERLPALRERVERVTHSADSLRWASQDRARQFADDDLAELGRQIETEASALRHWAPAGVTDVPGATAGATAGTTAGTTADSRAGLGSPGLRGSGR